MADTILSENPNQACKDCGELGIVMTHWGPLVPTGDPGCFCGECWTKRQAYYLEHGEPLPYRTKNEN